MNNKNSKYNKTKLVNLSLKLVKEKKLYRQSDLNAYLPVAKATFYKYVGKDGLEQIQEALEVNLVDMKVALRYKMFHSDKPADNIALYKLLADYDELRRLSNREIVTTEQKENKIIINLNGTEFNEEAK
jgi:hypothetical protein